MLLAVEIRGGRGDDGEVFARAANHGVAQVAEQLAHLARLVVVIHDELPRHPATDSAPPTLPLVHRVVVFEGDAVLSFQIHVPDSARIFGVAFLTFTELALLAQRLYAVQANLVLMKRREWLPFLANSADLPLWLLIP